MTVSSTTNKIIYTGTGATDTFPYPFFIYAKTDLTLTQVDVASGLETELVVDSDYTVEVDVDNNFTGNVILLDGNLASGQKLVILRQLPLTQEVDYTKHGPLLSESHEGALDKLTYICQQLKEEIDRCLKISVASTEEPTADELMEELNTAVGSAEADAASALSSKNAAAVSEANAAASEAAAAASQAALNLPTIGVGDAAKLIQVNGAGDGYELLTKASLLSALHPVGSIYISIVSTNPNTLFGFGTWTAFGAGRVLVGIDAGQTEFDTVEETGGAKTHTLAKSEIPPHVHTYSRVDAPGAADSGGALDTQSTSNTGDGSADGLAGAAHNNLQPYIVVYMWKRTA